jgi:uncharacterized SAM-binding protein YcdF (DUF218 family)
MADRCFEADAIVVLGCRGSAALTRRVDCGVGLFRGGAAPLLVLSGGGRGPVAEAERMRCLAVAAGVPESALLLDAVSRDTFENARETARLLRARGLASVLLVSDRTHLPRAAMLFRFAGLRVVGQAAAASRFRAGAAIREIAALPWSLLRVLLTIMRPMDRPAAKATCAKTPPPPASSPPRSAKTARAR